jgi:GAF domain-containing protein
VRPHHEARLFSLLDGQKQVFELIARGAALPDVLDRLVRLIEDHFPEGVRASILLVDEDGRRLLHGAAPNLPQPYNEAVDGLEIGPSAGSCGTAAHRGEPVIVEDIATDPLWADFGDLALAWDLRSCWSEPILGADGRVLGTFAIYHSEPWGPDQDDRTLLSTFVENAAVAIERHRDLTAILREKRSVEALHRVGQAIAARLELNEIVQLATDAATELTHASFGAFFYNVIGEDEESYLLYTLSGVPRAAFEKFPMPRNTAIFAPTFEGEGTVRMRDVTQDERFGRNPPFNGMPKGHLPVRSYLAVPVKTAGGEVAGGLFFGHPEPGVFDAEAERVAEGIAAQAGIAIVNARLYDAAQRQVTARRRAFEERDRVARVLQESLLPSALPTIEGVEIAAGYQPCLDGIGGDFYDVFPLPGDRWGIVIGDVCGKGVEAAALTARARHTVRTAALLGAGPAQALTILNEALREGGEAERYCTAVFAVLKTRDGGADVTLARAGHPHALVGRDGEVVTAGGTGRVLGVFDDVRVADETVTLGPGDAFVLHTDGLTDVGYPSAPAGQGWVLEAVARRRSEGAAAIVDALVHPADAPSPPQLGRDDIAVVALTV